MKWKIHTIHQGKVGYPERLKQIPSPPKQLYLLGNLGALEHTKSIGIVGSRAVTPYGRQVTYDLARKIAERGIAVISGLAIGVDALAHQAALEGGGYTVAVLAGGLDDISPRSNYHLAEEILLKGGAILSEYPEDVPPMRQNFIARNRIVAGLSDGLLVTQASAQSGALHTTKFALEQNKTVMAVPGDITNAMSQGTNHLLKKGATPVTSVEDILETLQLDSDVQNTAVMGSNAEEAIIIELIKRGISDINQLQTESTLSADLFNQTLTMLEVTGKIKPLGAGHYGIK